jgi:hypothetical protein
LDDGGGGGGVAEAVSSDNRPRRHSARAQAVSYAETRESDDDEDGDLDVVVGDSEYVKEEEADDEEALEALRSTSRHTTTVNLRDDDDEKPDLKPHVDVKYAGFSIFGKTLVCMFVHTDPQLITSCPFFLVYHLTWSIVTQSGTVASVSSGRVEPSIDSRDPRAQRPAFYEGKIIILQSSFCVRNTGRPAQNPHTPIPLRDPRI